MCDFLSLLCFNCVFISCFYFSDVWILNLLKWYLNSSSSSLIYSILVPLSCKLKFKVGLTVFQCADRLTGSRSALSGPPPSSPCSSWPQTPAPETSRLPRSSPSAWPPASVWAPSLTPKLSITCRSVFHLRQQNQLVPLTVGRRASPQVSQLCFFIFLSPWPQNSLVHRPVSAQVGQRGGAAGHLRVVVIHLSPDCPNQIMFVLVWVSRRAVFTLWCDLSSLRKLFFCIFWLHFHTEELPERMLQSQQNS